VRTKPLNSFASQFGVGLNLNPDSIAEKNGRFYLINVGLGSLIVKKDFFYAGVFLGKVKEGKFFPSFTFLSMLAKIEADRIVVNRKAAWLFICGRPILSKGILKVFGSYKKGKHVLVLNEFGECLGFGKVVGDLNSKSLDEVAVRNVSDIGDFLRRER
jgi:ribosome biogenesis protein Nip4